MLNFLSIISLLGIFTFLIAWRLFTKIYTDNVSHGLQGFVNKMKEYDLDSTGGILICSGRDLRVRYMDPTLEPLLGSPRYVNDLIPENLRDKHTRILSRYAGGKPLPDSLNHPLRNVPILCKDKTTVQARLSINKFDFISRIRIGDIYYVMVQPSKISRRVSVSSRSRPAWRRNSAYGGSFTCSVASASERDPLPEMQSCEDEIVRESCTGQDSSNTDITSNATNEERNHNYDVPDWAFICSSNMDQGLIPANETFELATVLFVDIVDFTRHCVEKDLNQISEWMTKIHTSIDVLLARYAIRKIETRGDCCVCVSGTSFVGDEGGESRDLPFDQATRMLHFGRDLGMAFASIRGTKVRMGMASGGVALSHIQHGGDTLPAMCAHGDTVTLASRMEQTGRAGTIQLSESAARAYAAEKGVAVPALQEKGTKGIGTVRSATYDCVNAHFLLPKPGASHS